MLNLALYLTVLSAIGLWRRREAKNFEEYFLSDRKLGLFEASLTLASTWVDAAIMLGFAGYCYSFGYDALWLAIPTSVGIYSFSIFFARRINRNSGSFTVGEIMKRAYGEKVSVASSFFVLFYSIALMGANIMAGGYIMESIFKVPFLYGVVITLTFALLYTILGGFRKVVETDILQFFLVIIGVFIVFFFSIKAVGGWSKIQEIASSYPSSFSRWEIVSFFIVFSFPLWADPSFYQRCSAAKDPRTASLGIAFVGLVDSFMTFVGLGIGLAGVYIIGNNANPDTIFPSLVETILPTGLRELVGLAILSAVMSTVDSYLLIAGGVFANDILHPLGLKWDGVKLSKIGTFLSAIFAFLSLSIFSDIIDAAIFAFSLFASTSLIPLVLALVLGPRSDFVLPSLVSMFAGGVTVIAWKLLKLGDTSVSVLYGLAISGGIWLLLFSFRTFKHLKTRG